MRCFSAFFVACLVSCTSRQTVNVTPTFPDLSQDRMRMHMNFLASDELEGREAGTKGEKIAALYLQNQLHSFGLRPFALQKFAADSVFSFLQPYEATKISLLPGTVMTVYDSSTRKEMRLTYGEYFSNFHEYLFPTSIQGPLVFAGYGITAPEYNHDDYATLDVKGKIVVVLEGEPSSDDPAVFNGILQTYYSSTMFYKRHRAKELGARGIIALAYPQLLSKWSDFIDYFQSSSMSFSTPALFEPDSARTPFFYCGHAFLERILAGQLVTYDSLRSLIASGKPLPVFPLRKLHGTIRVNTQVSVVRSNNVIGVIEGRDPKLKDEFVAIGAHYDHLGVDAQGNVFNGADDDASGTIAVLEAARALAASKQNRRSILVVFHGGEEKGLLGSEFLTDSTTDNAFRMSQIVAQVNLDMVGREHEDSLFVIGAGRLSSEMAAIVEDVNREDSLFHYDYTFDREDDPNRYYFRSDHYNYARYNIPIVFFFDGMEEDYHKITDDIERINFRKIEKVSRLATKIILRIANREERLKVDRATTNE